MKTPNKLYPKEIVGNIDHYYCWVKFTFNDDSECFNDFMSRLEIALLNEGFEFHQQYALERPNLYDRVEFRKSYIDANNPSNKMNVIRDSDFKCVSFREEAYKAFLVGESYYVCVQKVKQSETK